MGCVSSTLFNKDEDFPQIGGFSHHIVSLTSTTYGFLTLDPSPPRVPLGSLFASEPHQQQPPLETINSWDLMSGLDSDHIPSFRFSTVHYHECNDENISTLNSFLEGFENICPPKGENKVVMYSTTLRGVRKTFEDCNAVRSAIQGLGISICERDVSMDRGFRDELRELMKGKGGKELMIPPRVFVKGRYIGGVEEVIKIVEEGLSGKLIQGLPKSKGGACEGCGGVGFLPCFRCHWSCKLVVVVKGGKKTKTTVVRCSECNENGLVLCAICSR